MKTYTSFIDLTPLEQEALLTAEIEKVMQEKLDKGSYITYTNELCVTDDLFIHEYKDGRKYLVRVDHSAVKVHTVKRVP